MLLARMAEAVYWAGRYLERAEGTARIVQVHTDAHVDMPVGEDVGWEPLLAIAGVDSEFAERYSAAAGARRRRAAEQDVIEFLLHGEGNDSSILASLTAARENLRTARPVVPREAWEACNNLWLACNDHLAEADSREGRVQWLRRVIAGCQRINGILLGTMSRDEAMSFLTSARTSSAPTSPPGCSTCARRASDPTGATIPTTSSTGWPCSGPWPPTSRSAGPCRPGPRAGRHCASSSRTTASPGRSAPA